MGEKQDNPLYSGCSALFSVNPKIYPIDVVYSAAYIMIDKAFILLDGDPETNIKVSIRCKNEGQEIKQLVQEFNEELLNYSVYKVQSEKNKDLREIILKRVLITNEVIKCMEEIKNEMFIKNVDDTEHIFQSWEKSENASTEKEDKA